MTGEAQEAILRSIRRERAQQAIWMSVTTGGVVPPGVSHTTSGSGHGDQLGTRTSRSLYTDRPCFDYLGVMVASEFPEQLPDATKPPAKSGVSPESSGKKEKGKAALHFSNPQTTVDIVVGAAGAERAFVVHKAYICEYSDFFDRAFNGEFKEGETQSMTIDDIDGKLFGYMVHWVYHQTVFEDESTEPDTLTLVKLWQLGERFLMPKLQNHLTAILRSTVAKMGIDCCRVLDYLYSEDCSTAEPLKRLFVAGFSHHMRNWEPFKFLFPQAFFVDVASYLMSIHDQVAPYYLPYMKDASNFYVEE